MYNIDPRVWGPSGWEFLHYITLAYPDNPTEIDKENAKIFFPLVGKMLPCQICRSNFASHLKKFPLDDQVLENRYNLVNWLINIHNEVNRVHGKPIMSYQEVINKYLNKRPSGIGFHINSKILTVAVMFVIILILIFIMKFNRN